MSVINTTAHLPGGSLDRHPIMSSAPPMSQLIALQLENARLLDDLKIAFHRHFNKSQSISRLPPEILLEIFRILRLKWWYQSRPQSEASSTTEHIPFELGWIKVSHVCHRWREILIAHPSLWNTVDCTRASGPWIEEMLRRAHPTTDSQMPIEFIVNTTSPDDNVGHDGASMKILSIAVSLPYAAALQSLEITSWESDTMLELCKRTLPNLESLTLLQDEHSGIIDIHAETLASLAPSLKDLFLFQCTISWATTGNEPTFPHLTDLVIDCTAFPDSMEAIDVRALHEHNNLTRLLKDMPKLETLKLHDAVPYMQPDLPKGRTLPIHLPPHLRYIDISGQYCANHCVELASRIVLSPRTEIIVDMQSGLILPYTSFRSTLEPHIGPRHPPKALRLWVSKSLRKTSVEVRAWSGEAYDKLEWLADPDAMGNVCVAFDMEVNAGALCPGLCATQLELLEVQLWFEQYIDVERVLFPKAEWLSSFSSARKVRKIRLNDVPSALALFEALVEGLEGRETPPPAQDVLFPSLDTLLVANSQHSHCALVSEMETERMIECVDIRRRHGYPIPNLCLPLNFWRIHRNKSALPKGSELCWNLQWGVNVRDGHGVVESALKEKDVKLVVQNVQTCEIMI